MTEGERRVIESPICLNCDGPIEYHGDPVGDLFCSKRCVQAASAVRYARKRHVEGRADDPDIKQAIRIKIGSVLGGGYPEKARALSKSERNFIFERDSRRCVQCGTKATEVDPLGKPELDMNDPDNLQALCRKCHVEKTKRSMRPVKTIDEQLALAALLTRIDAERPLRICDAADWADRWHTYRRMRRVISIDWV